MKRPITVIEFLIALIPIFGGLIGAYLSLRDTANKHEIRLQYVENGQMKMYDKLEKISEDCQNIRIMLEKKEDRKDERIEHSAF